MPSAVLKGAASAALLRAAGSLTLQGGAECAGSGAAAVKRLGMRRSSSIGAASVADATTDPRRGRNRLVDTVWDEGRHPSAQNKQLEELAAKADTLRAVFEVEARTGDQLRGLEDELHEEQLRRLGEIGSEVNESMRALVALIDGFVRDSQGLLTGTFKDLHRNLRARIESLRPRIEQLRASAWAVRSGVEEERAARVSETTQYVEPIKKQLAKLTAGIQEEQKIREARQAEIQQGMSQAVMALGCTLDAETSSREQRVAATFREWQHAQELLLRRQDKLEQGLTTVQEGLMKATSLETDHRIAAQDPVVMALTGFIHKFQANARERSLCGG